MIASSARSRFSSTAKYGSLKVQWCGLHSRTRSLRRRVEAASAYACHVYSQGLELAVPVTLDLTLTQTVCAS